MPPPLQILWEDNHCIAVFKSAGVLMAGDRTGDESLLDLVKQYLKVKYQKPGEVYLGLVHRLDRPVSGVALFARTSKAAGRLSEQFRLGTTEKVYRAWVLGCPSPSSGRMEDWLLKDTQRNFVKVVRPGTASATDAELTYHTVTTNARFTQLEIRPKTGRPHQIRVQLSSRGWPILGDVKYGGPACREPRAIALHALSLSFDHPTTRERLRVHAEIPETWPHWFIN